MQLLAHSRPLVEMLSETPPDTGWEWSVWGPPGDLSRLQSPQILARPTLVCFTADDTEARLLGESPEHCWWPFVLMPAARGGAVPQSLQRQPGQTWSDVLSAAELLDWSPRGERPTAVCRPPLVPQPWRTATAAERQIIRTALGRLRVSSAADATALEAGWLQLLDDLDASHQCSQSIEGRGRHQAGDYWHAIMHRREPDYGNSRYWFRQFGAHPIYPQLVDEARRVADGWRSLEFDTWLPRLIAGDSWRPTAFVECCEAAAASDDGPFRTAVEELQYREMLCLLRQTAFDALGR
jgi:hypothetical protein